MILGHARYIGFQGEEAATKTLPMPRFRRSRGNVEHVAMLAAESAVGGSAHRHLNHSIDFSIRGYTHDATPSVPAIPNVALCIDGGTIG